MKRDAALDLSSFFMSVRLQVPWEQLLGVRESRLSHRLSFGLQHYAVVLKADTADDAAGCSSLVRNTDFNVLVIDDQIGNPFLGCTIDGVYQTKQTLGSYTILTRGLKWQTAYCLEGIRGFSRTVRGVGVTRADSETSSVAEAWTGIAKMLRQAYMKGIWKQNSCLITWWLLSVWELCYVHCLKWVDWLLNQYWLNM